MKVRIEDYISLTEDSRTGYIRGQSTITIPLAKRQEFAENMAEILRDNPSWNKSEAHRAAVREMADRIRERKGTMTQVQEEIKAGKRFIAEFFGKVKPEWIGAELDWGAVRPPGRVYASSPTFRIPLQDICNDWLKADVTEMAACDDDTVSFVHEERKYVAHREARRHRTEGRYYVIHINKE